jgi:hypothetical protein
LSQLHQQFASAALDAAIPPLAALGFIHDARDVTPDVILRRPLTRDALDVVQIIEFQLGTGALEGHFTVNLAVYSPRYTAGEPATDATAPNPLDCLLDMTRRLGFLLEPPRGPLARLFRRDRRQPSDRWWRVSSRPRVMRRTLASVTACIHRTALPWFETMSCDAQFRRAMDLLQQRQELVARRGQPKVIGPLFHAGDAITNHALQQKFLAAMKELRDPTPPDEK